MIVRTTTAWCVLLLIASMAMAMAACATTGGIEGTVASIDSAASTFLLTPQPQAAGGRGLTVSISPNTAFRGALHRLADLTVGMHVRVRGTADTSTSTLVATEIEDQQQNSSTHQSGAQDSSKVTGTVASVDTTHSSFLLMLADNTTRTVTISPMTEFEGGVHGLADLVPGQRVSVEGTLQTDGSIAAASVEADNEQENDPDEANQADLTGTMSGLDTPHASFVLTLPDNTTITVVTTSQTEFDGGFSGFSDLRSGMRVEVRGTVQHNSSLLATRVHREDGGSDSGGSSSSVSGSGSGSGGGSDGGPDGGGGSGSGTDGDGGH